MENNVSPIITSREDPYPASAVNALGTEPNNPPWGFWAAFALWLLSIGLVVFVPFFFVVPYAFNQGMTFGTPEQNQAFLQFLATDKMSIILQIAALFPIHLLTMLMVWALVTGFRKRPFASTIGLNWGNVPALKALAICTGLGIALFMIGSVIAKVLGGDTPNPMEQIIHSSWTARYLVSFLAVATAPLAEEFVYRGVLYAPLQRAVGVKGAVLIVLGIFTLIHVPQYLPNLGVIAAVFLLSVALTLIRALWGRLLPCVIIHLVFNSITAVILVLEPYLQRFMPTPEPVTPPALILWPLIGLLT